MGKIKDAKADILRTQAARAVEEGRTVFAPMLNTPKTQPRISSSIAGWAEMIEAVEGEGWELTHWSTTTDVQGRPQAYPLFRRSAN